MAQLTIKVSAKADAMIAQLQKEIFNRRRKKVTAQGVVETLVESGAKSQSDKRFATSWKNLIKDIEKAAKQSEIHGNKPANVSAEEWALILAHRNRKSTAAKKVAKSTKVKTSKKASLTKKTVAKVAAKKPVAKKSAVKQVSSASKRVTKAVTPRPARRARRANRATASAAQ